MTKRFYDAHAASFSATRNAPWEGWRKAAHIFAHAVGEDRSLNVLDIGCGNFRFERFLLESLKKTDIRAVCIDTCKDFIEMADFASHQNLSVLTSNTDVVTALQNGSLTDSIENMMPENRFDLSVAFGFMHHVPTFSLRAALLEKMVECTRQHGIIACSFWQFANDQRLKEKALAATRISANSGRAEFDIANGDYAMFWQNDETQIRYCHHFLEEEIDSLLESITSFTKVIARFSSDGKNNNLNEYVILEVL